MVSGGKGICRNGDPVASPSMQPRGSAGEESTTGSQQLQGNALHELLETWPSDAWREAGKATPGIEYSSAVGCQGHKRQGEAGEALAEISPAGREGGGPAVPGLAGEAKGAFHVAKKR